MPQSRLRVADLLTTSAVAFRTRPLRSSLSALGVAIGISALIAVVGITGSNRAALLAQIDRLGTNILTASDSAAGQGQPSAIPAPAAAMIGRIPGVERVSPTAVLPTLGVYRNDRIPSNQTAGLNVIAVDPTLLITLGASTQHGAFLNAATARYPVTVLGSAAAASLGIRTLRSDTRVWIGGHWFSVAGIDQPIPLAPNLDRAALIGAAAADTLFGYKAHPTTLYIRTDVQSTAQVAPLIGRTAFPQDPSDVAVAQPTAALAARAAAVGASTTLLLGLAGITLTIAGIGVANVMIIAVLERRHEIGIRRALGATRAHIRRQFLTEAIAVSTAGAIAGLTLGTTVTAGVAMSHGWPVLISTRSLVGGFVLAVLVGAGAGLLPAVRAARQSPTQVLRG